MEESSILALVAAIMVRRDEQRENDVVRNPYFLSRIEEEKRFDMSNVDFAIKETCPNHRLKKSVVL